MRRYIPLFGMVTDFIGKILAPLSVWDKVREMKKGHFPNGSSFKTIAHYAQIIAQGGTF